MDDESERERERATCIYYSHRNGSRSFDDGETREFVETIVFARKRENVRRRIGRPERRLFGEFRGRVFSILSVPVKVTGLKCRPFSRRKTGTWP